MTGERWEPAPGAESGRAEDRSDSPTARARGTDDDRSTHVYNLGPDESPCVGVVSAVAAVTGRETASLAPLYDAVDSDALDRLVGDEDGGAGDRSISVTFGYAGVTVTVDSTGRIHLQR